MTAPEIKPEWVEAFRAAWLTAGVRGRPEHRIEAALAEVAPLIAAQALRDAAEECMKLAKAQAKLGSPAAETVARVAGLLDGRAYRIESGRADQ